MDSWSADRVEAFRRDGFIVHPEHVDPTYSRYRRVDDTTMDESFFPIVWTRDGYRTGWLERLVDDQHVAVRVP